MLYSAHQCQIGLGKEWAQSQFSHSLTSKLQGDVPERHVSCSGQFTVNAHIFYQQLGARTDTDKRWFNCIYNEHGTSKSLIHDLFILFDLFYSTNNTGINCSSLEFILLWNVVQRSMEQDDLDNYGGQLTSSSSITRWLTSSTQWSTVKFQPETCSTQDELYLFW